MSIDAVRPTAATTPLAAMIPQLDAANRVDDSHGHRHVELPAPARTDESGRPDAPSAVLDAKLGSETFADAYQRLARFEFHGDGAPSSREIVPVTAAAKQIASSPAWTSMQALLRSAASVADVGAPNHEDLASITFSPDENSVVADTIIRFVSGLDDRQKAAWDATPQSEVDAELASVVDDQKSHIAFSAAWNGGGDIMLMPDVSRELLSTIGAYTPKDGDSLVKDRELGLRDGTITKDVPDHMRKWSNAEWRDTILREAYRTLAHEVHHSVSPLPSALSGHANSRVWEEVVPSILEAQEGARVAQSVNATIRDTTLYPKQAPDHAELGWQPWNRSGLPQPDEQLQKTSKARYRSGPEVVRTLIGLAGIDRRTSAGQADVMRILQSESAAAVPALLAQEIARGNGLDPTPGEMRDLIGLVRQSVESPVGSKAVEQLVAWLEQHGAAT